MVRWNEGNRWHRAGAALGALAVQFVFAALFVWGLAVHGDSADRSEPLEAVTSIDLPPPSPEPRADPEPPAPEGLEAEALPVEAPEAPATLAPTPAAPEAGEGAEAGVGQGDRGAGRGAGGVGSGGGGGGIATPARRLAGALRDSDYPRAAERAGAEGTVVIGFRVRTDGRVDRCSIVQSSGHAVLDDLTCRLFTQRYRFRPAMTAEGRPVESTLRTSFTWGTRRR